MIASGIRQVTSRITAGIDALRYRATHGNAPLLILHLQETGLREHVEPVMSWLLEHDDCELLIVVRHSQRAAYLKQTSLPVDDNPRLAVVDEEGFAARLYAARVVVSIHPESVSSVARGYEKTRRRPFRVVMQHGMADKEVFYVPDGRGNTLAHSDGVFLIGPSAREGSLRQYANVYPEHFRRLTLFNIGAPKTDALTRGDLDRRMFLSHLGLDPDRKTICYAPTYQRTASLEQRGLEIIHALSELDANVIVKLHHVSLKRPSPDLEHWARMATGGKDWRAAIGQVEAQRPNVRLAPTHDANPYLQASDALVTDVSGVAFEYLLLDRPIIFFDVPDLFAELGHGVHYWGRSCGDIVETGDELRTAARDVLESPTHKAAERHRLQNALFYNRGCATQMAGEALRALLAGTELAERP